MDHDTAAVVFENLPIPPTSNMQYAVVFRTSGRQFVPKKELVAFKRAMRGYFERNLEGTRRAREALAGGKALSVQTFLGFEKTRLFTKKGNFKRLDVSNRLKALHDCLAEALQIDDSCFFNIGATKYAVETKEEEHCCVHISILGEDRELPEGQPPSAA